jgi:hypothetical protein
MPQGWHTKGVEDTSLASSGTNRFFIEYNQWYKTRYYLLSYNHNKILFKLSLGESASITLSLELFKQH